MAFLTHRDARRIDNYQYSEIHKIFRQLDVLHILGGGYINTVWKDMLYEVYLSCKLAQKYGAKVLATGISIYPYDLQYGKYLHSIIDSCEYVDFRDDSYKIIPSDWNCTNISCSCDDAWTVGSIGAKDAEPAPEYINLTFTQNIEKSECITASTQNILIPFIEKVLDNHIVHHINVIEFAPGDLDIWKQAEKSVPDQYRKSIHYVSFINRDMDYCLHLLADAKCNIGSRYHMAAVSLLYGVPAYAIYYDNNYYKNKISELFELADLHTYASADQLTVEDLLDFVGRIPSARDELNKQKNKFLKLCSEKNQKIANVYSVNSDDAEALTTRLDAEKPVRVSVIIPIYNMERYLKQCLDSITSQTLEDIEIICVNDGSTDYTQNILYENAWKDKRIKVIEQSNQGVSAARNRGLKEAVGEFVSFIDPDDWLADNKVLEDMYWAAKNHDVLAAGGQFVEHNEALNKVIDSWDGDLSRYKFDHEGIEEFKIFQFDFGWIRFIYNREFLIQNNLYFPARVYFEDPVWFVQVMSKAEKFYAMTRDVYCYRTGFKSYSLSERQIIDLIRGVIDNIKIAEEKNYSDLLHLEIRRITQFYSREVIKYLGGKNHSSNVASLINQLNDEVAKLGYYNVEYDLFHWADFYNCNDRADSVRKEAEKEKLQLVKERDDLYRHVVNLTNDIDTIKHSMTWKIGNIILALPKMVARKIRREEKR